MNAACRGTTSRVVERGRMVYVQGTPSEPVGDVKAQTQRTLECIDGLLAIAGTNKSKVLTAQVWLSDMKLFAEHDLAWNEWIDPQARPVRACKQAAFRQPEMLVEIMVTATK